MNEMLEQNLNSSRSKLIDYLCGLSPIFVMTIFLMEFKEWSWWRYLAGLGAWFVVYKLYCAIFKRFLCPKSVDRQPIDDSRKFVYYTVVVGFTLISICVFSVLPLGFAANLALSIVVNFILTMWFCYIIAKAPKTSKE